jgi:hypothetical protein
MLDKPPCDDDSGDEEEEAKDQFEKDPIEE